MRPLVGMTMTYRRHEESWSISRDNSKAVWAAGGLPLALPWHHEGKGIQAYAERLDGLLLTGGNDIDPHLFGEEPIPGLGEVEPERDRAEIALVREMISREKPILAICRGCQILAIALGGEMYQDLGSQREGILQHSQRAPRAHASHSIRIQRGSRLHRLAGTETVRVNSFHHQAVRRVPDGCSVAATAPDGVVEAFESEGKNFVVGVQWHPENMMSDEPFAFHLFAAFIEACIMRAEQKAISSNPQ